MKGRLTLGPDEGGEDDSERADVAAPPPVAGTSTDDGPGLFE